MPSSRSLSVELLRAFAFRPWITLIRFDKLLQKLVSSFVVGLDEKCGPDMRQSLGGLAIMFEDFSEIEVGGREVRSAAQRVEKRGLSSVDIVFFPQAA